MVAYIIRDLPRPQCQPNKTYCTAVEGFLIWFSGLWDRNQACHQNRKKERKSLGATVLKQPLEQFTKPPLLQESRLTGGESPNLVGLVEREGPVERFIGAANIFH